MAEGDTLANALVGAVVTVFTTSVVAPVAPLLGGAVSGYLQGGDGVRVGALSGAIALLPLLLFLALLGNFILFVSVAGEPSMPTLGALGVALLALLFLSTAVYIVVLSALGGWVGVYLKTDTDL